MSALGKTVLSSTIIKDLLKHNPDNNTAYFYFDFNDRTKQYHDNMLRSLLVQLFSTCKHIPVSLNSLFNSCQNGAKQPQTEELEELLKVSVESSAKTVVALDALDECEDRQELLDFINRTLEWKSKKLNLVMTSRKLKDLNDFFSDELDERSIIPIQNENVDEDIRSYVHTELQKDKRFRRWQKQPKVQEEIETKIAGKSDGMYESENLRAYCSILR